MIDSGELPIKPAVNSVVLYDISAIELTTDYTANEAKADYEYKGKEILVIGEITGIRRGGAGDIIVVLKGIEKKRAVACSYNDEQDAQTLEKGMTVAFKGRCDGLRGNVMMSNCIRMFEKIK